PPLAGTVAPAAGVDVETSTWVQAILSRPLFTPDRRPAPTDEPAQDDEPADEVAAPVPRLAGIAVGPRGRQALFQPAGGGKPVLVGEGDEVAGWVVETIAVDRVTITGSSGTVAV